VSAEQSSELDELYELYDGAARLYRTGDPMAAHRRAAWLKDHLAAQPETPRRRRFMGLAEELLGYVYADQGAEQAALEAFLRAEQMLAQDEENTTLCGRVRFRLGLACADLGMDEQAEYYLGLAQCGAEATDYGDALEFFRDRHERVVDDWEVEADRLRSALHEARAAVDRLSGSSDESAMDTAVRMVMTFEGDLAELIVEHGDEDAAIDALIRIAAVGGALGGEGHARAFMNYTRALSALVLRPHFQFSAVLEDLVPMAEDLARQNGGHELRAHARFLAALLAWQEDDSDGALGHALAAVADGELAVVLNRSEVLRMRLRTDLDVRRDFALSLAVSQNRPELVAELVEGQRLQALPVSGPASAIAGELLLGDIMAASEASLTHIVDVSVNGRSQLQPFPAAASAIARPPALPLERAIRAVGGDDARRSRVPTAIRFHPSWSETWPRSSRFPR
jgi:tetratricopeptide (TPR) repeat protein